MGHGEIKTNTKVQKVTILANDKERKSFRI